MAASSPPPGTSLVEIGLMVGAAGLAWWAPLPVFALAYVVLGPLHYLTQISWMHGHGFGLSRRAGAGLLAGLALGAWAILEVTPWPFEWAAALIVGAPLIAVGWVLPAGHTTRSIAFGAALLVPALLWTSPALGHLAILIPTLVHVFVFTLVFMLTGALARRDRLGLVSVAVCVGLAVALVLGAGPAVGPGWPTEVFAPFEGVRDTLGLLLGVPARTLAAFMAWAYTWHYLNWFSKVRLLAWHRVSGRRAALIAAAWLACVGLYLWDYALGFVVVGTLGMLHVFLELPLDARAIGRLWSRPT